MTYRLSGSLSPRGYAMILTASTTIAIPAAGASSQGKSAIACTFAASCNIDPQLGVGSANQSPTYDRMASAKMNAGSSSVA